MPKPLRSRSNYMNNTKEDKMDKYGVDEGVDQEAQEKKAAKGCPVCGAQPAQHGKVLICPTHGSEPFEEKSNS